MGGYEEFVARLKSEIEEADLGREEARFAGLSRQQPRRRAALLRIAAAAALAIAAGVGGYAGYGVIDSRRVLREENSRFVDALFERGLFDVEVEAPLIFDGPTDWGATAQVPD